MNVELQYTIEFPAMIYHPEDLPWSLMCNQYEISLQLLTGTHNKKQINIAMERLKVFVLSELSNTVFVSEAHRPQAEMLAMMGANVTTLPEEPVDQIIGIMLYCKLNAVMEGRMKITQLDISSALGDSVWYKHSEDDALGPFVNDGWWFNSSTKHSDLEDSATDGNVVHVGRSAWLDYDLGWSDSDEKLTSAVVYANFARNEDK